MSTKRGRSSSVEQLETDNSDGKVSQEEEEEAVATISKRAKLGDDEQAADAFANARSPVGDLRIRVPSGNISGEGVDGSNDKIQTPTSNTPMSFEYLMNASAMANPESAQMVRTLLDCQSDVSVTDRYGYSVLHWAAACDRTDLLTLLLHHSPVARGMIDLQDNEGETALHRCCRLGHSDCVRVLLQHSAKRLRDNHYQSPLEVMGLYNGRRNSGRRHAVRETMYTHDPTCRTLVLSHEDCLNHITVKGHQEAPARQRAILNKLQNGTFQEFELDFCSEFLPAPRKVLHLAHSPEYIDTVFQLGRLSKESGTPVPFTPYVQRNVQGVPDGKLKKAEFCDTNFSEGSLQASLRAVGAVMHGIDAVMQGSHRNAFCCVRPPGHHAGVNGLLHNAVSCGFCIFNSVAIGALYALAMYSSVRIPTLQKKVSGFHSVALSSGKSALNVYSTSFSSSSSSSSSTGDSVSFNTPSKLSRGKTKEGFAAPAPSPKRSPGSGLTFRSPGFSPQVFSSVSSAGMLQSPMKRHLSSNRQHTHSIVDRVAIVDIDVHHGNGTQEIVENVRLPNNILFFSIHLFDKGQSGYQFYPGSGQQSVLEGNVINAPIPPLWKKKTLSQRATTRQTSFAASQSDGSFETKGEIGGRMEFRRRIEATLLPALRAFNPDLILISAGFDGVKHDVGNKQLQRDWEGLDLNSSDYDWVTSRIVDVANITCNGRVVSVLEGGYGGPPAHMRTTTPSPKIYSPKSMRNASSAVSETEQTTRSSSDKRGNRARKGSKKASEERASAEPPHPDVAEMTSEVPRTPIKTDTSSLSDHEDDEPEVVYEIDREILATACHAHVKALVRYPK